MRNGKRWICMVCYFNDQGPDECDCRDYNCDCSCHQLKGRGNGREADDA